MILVAGSANLDFVVRAPRIPAPGETVLGGDFRVHPGGKGANQAVACARAGGADTAMLLALGEDWPAQVLESSLKSAGVRLHLVRIREQPTGTAFICVSDDGENAITVAPGANSLLRPAHLPKMSGATHLLMQLETPLETVTAFAQAARAEGVKVVLNAAPARELPPELLAALDLLIVNEGELAELTGGPSEMRRALQQLPVPRVIATLAERGCCALSQGQFIEQPGYTVRAIDTTAAGDTFCGVVVAALDRGVDLPEAMRRANAAAALACTAPGAQSSIPNAQAVLQFMQRSKSAAGQIEADPSRGPGVVADQSSQLESDSV